MKLNKTILEIIMCIHEQDFLDDFFENSCFLGTYKEKFILVCNIIDFIDDHFKLTQMDTKE